MLVSLNLVSVFKHKIVIAYFIVHTINIGALAMSVQGAGNKIEQRSEERDDIK